MRRAVGVLIAAGLAGCGGSRIPLPAPTGELIARATADSLDAHARYDAGLAHWNARRWEQARAEFNAALRLDRNLAAAHMALALLPLDQAGISFVRQPRSLSDSLRAQLDRAPALYRHAYMLDPYIEPRLFAVVMMRGSPALIGPVAAIAYIAEGDYEGAYTMLEFYRSRFPTDRLGTEYFWYRAESAIQMGLPHEAVGDLNELLVRTYALEDSDSLTSLGQLPTNLYRFMLGALYQDMGNHNQAIYLFREALAEDIGLFMAHARLGDIYEHMRLFDEALAAREAALALDPDNPLLLRQMSGTLQTLGRLDDAMTYLTLAREAAPWDPLVHYQIGTLEQAAGRPDRAADALREFLRLSSERHAALRADAESRLAGAAR